MEVWPGGPYPLGASYDGAGTNFALFSEVADGVELCLFDRRRRRDPHRDDRARRPGLAHLPAARRTRPALRIPRLRPVRAQGRATLQPQQAADRPVRPAPSKARSTGHLRASRTTSTIPIKRNDEDSAPHTMMSVVVNPFFDWQEDRRASNAVPRDGRLRGPRQGNDQDPSRHPRGDPGNVRRDGAPGDDRPPHRSSVSRPSS